MKLIPLLFLILLFSCLGRKAQITKSQKDASSFIDYKNFEIRQKPILNREYIIFLCWSIQVHGFSYPERVFEILPENSIIGDPYCGNGFEPLFSSIHPNSLLKNYILNPAFLDYPLIGLSEFQIMEMEKWLNDRYNESLLIENKYLKYSAESRDEECFTTESFLTEQYMGEVERENNLTWKENNFKSVFRLPFLNELTEVLENEKLENGLVEYSFNENDFLWLWNKVYFLPSENSDTLKLSVYPPIFVYDFKKPNAILTNSFSVASLPNREKSLINLRYLKLEPSDLAPYDFKGQYGRMKFNIIGSNDIFQPIIADRTKYSKKTKLENKLYRIVCSKVLDKKYWP